jgi:hypothetical protein
MMKSHGKKYNNNKRKYFKKLQKLKLVVNININKIMIN